MDVDKVWTTDRNRRDVSEGREACACVRRQKVGPPVPHDGTRVQRRSVREFHTGPNGELPDEVLVGHLVTRGKVPADRSVEPGLDETAIDHGGRIATDAVLERVECDRSTCLGRNGDV